MYFGGVALTLVFGGCGGDVIVTRYDDGAMESNVDATSIDADTVDTPIDARSFSCGTLTCAGNEFCLVIIPPITGAYADGARVPNPTQYSCNLIPPNCLANLTCECLWNSVPQGYSECAQTNGHWIVTPELA
jgi:hypothetical protein